MTTRSRSILTGRIVCVRDFFAHRIWEPRLDELPGRTAFGYRFARLLYCAAHGLLVSDRLHVRAAALTYYTVLSLVPLLAFAFALLKGFGAYDALIEQTVRPYVLDTFTGNPALRIAFEQMLASCEQPISIRTDLLAVFLRAFKQRIDAACRVRCLALRVVIRIRRPLALAPHANGPSQARCRHEAEPCGDRFGREACGADSASAPGAAVLGRPAVPGQYSHAQSSVVFVGRSARS
jgi:hypothetical protein